MKEVQNALLHTTLFAVHTYQRADNLPQGDAAHILVQQVAVKITDGTI